MEAPNDTPKLSRDTRILLYEEARKPVRVNRGTPYPCTEDDLDTCREQGSMCVSNNPPYVTTFQATAQLCDWLNLEREPTARSMSALMRLNHYMWKLSWGPDIVIKAFRDLDIAFFDSILMGRVTVEWLCRTDWARLPGTEDSFGKTRWRNHRQCRIMLNADAILLNMSISPEPFTRMWQVIAHEMCVSGYFFQRRFESLEKFG